MARCSVCAMLLGLFIGMVALEKCRAAKPEGGTDGKNAWLEGKVEDEAGQRPLTNVEVVDSNTGERLGYCFSDAVLGRMYSFRAFQPGIYEIRVAATQEGYKAQRIWGVEVKPGVRTVL